MPAADHAVRIRPWIALTNWVPKMSARYAGTVAKPPPYIDRRTQTIATNSATLPARAADGDSAYSAMPSTKNVAYVSLRPILSEIDAQKNRPAMLNNDSRPVNPAAMVAIAFFWLSSSWVNPTLAAPISLPPKISCSIGDA